MTITNYKNLRFYTIVLLFIVLLGFVLYEGRLLFIPLGFAMMICFMYYPVGVRVEQKLGRTTAIAVVLIILTLIGFFLYNLVASTLTLLHQSITDSSDKIGDIGEGALGFLENIFGIDPDQQKNIVQFFYQNLMQETVPLIKQTISLSIGTLAMFFIIPIFVSLIFYYRELLVKFILMVVPENQIEGFKSTIRETTITYFKFAKGMGLVYLIVGFLNSLGFVLIGLPNAIYLGVLASILTFFPYIGILLGGLAAVIVAMTTFDSFWYPMGVVAVLGVVQYLEANVIFPMVVGHQLKLNTLSTLIAMFIGGIIWGAAGLILFVPFAAILKILADRIEGLRPLSVLLGPDTREHT
ncbi:MAG: AI-2E family transporter [Saprospiraceae bacterium]|nr:AI-2E family transporter [Saprospiraceae bacterium]